jgi:hypothetical protein
MQIMAPTPNLERPTPENTEIIARHIEGVRCGDEDAIHTARLAAIAGFLLIGTTKSKSVHHPVNPSEHFYHDLLDDFAVKPIPEATGSQKLLRASTNAGIAGLCALFGDFNSRRERIARCTPVTGRETGNFGWGVDIHASRTFLILPGAGANIATNARPELIRAATDPDNPFTGCIDLVYPDETFARITHDFGQYFGTRAKRTIMSIPLRGDIDLPINILPMRYERDIKDINI